LGVHAASVGSLPEALRSSGSRVGPPRELTPVLAEARQGASPTVVDVPVDYSETPFIGRGTSGRFYGGQEAACRKTHSPRRSAEYGNSTDHDVPNRSAARARARAASTSRFRGSASVTSEARRCRATRPTSVTARMTAAAVAPGG